MDRATECSAERGVASPDRSATRLPPDRDCIAARSLILNLTLRCPLRCRHCCYRSDMTQAGCLALPDVERAIRDAAGIPEMSAVHMIGGDPFLLPNLMLSAIRIARSHGLAAAATTSAFFAKSRERALAILTPMAEAGLGELTISYDDMHAAFVPERFIVHAVEALRTVGIPFLVAVTRDPGARIDAAYMRNVLGVREGDESEKVYEVTANSTGRAADLADGDGRAERCLQPGVYRGACHSVLQNFQVTDQGRILPCCGVLPPTEEMVLGEVNGPGGLRGAVERAYDDPLWKWIAFEGPVSLLCQVTAGDPAPLKPEDFDGICQACDRLFNDPALLARARAALPGKRGALAAQEMVLAALGKFQPPERTNAGAAVAGDPAAEADRQTGTGG